MIGREVVEDKGEENEPGHEYGHETVEDGQEDLAPPGEYVALHCEVWFGCSVGLVEGDDEREAVLDPVALEYMVFHFW